MYVQKVNYIVVYMYVEVRRLDSTFHIDLAYYCEEGAHGAQIICDFLKSH